MENWKVYAKKADFMEIGRRYNIDPVVARIIRNRDVITMEEIDMFFSKDMSKLHDPWLLKDMSKAIHIVETKIAKRCKIRIIGDYDIDGICSIFILMTSLKKAGADVDYAVPDRVHDGYGINISLVMSAINDGIDTIITCDNGIAADEAIRYAKDNGLTVIVTDHHSIPFKMVDECKVYSIPDADALIDPWQELCEYPYNSICGAMVAYKFASCLYERYDIHELHCLVPYAAIATIGDIMPLKDENRIIVKCGLTALTSINDIGLSALIRECGLADKSVTSYDIGFRLGPCLNASGRLESARYAIDLLLSDDEDVARELAKKLVNFNDDRKKLTEKSTEIAINMASQPEYAKDKVLVLYVKECHESIAGIVAGRVKEHFNKPTIVITDGEECKKGSARSIEAYNMFEELSKVKELFEKFGGHSMAAGLSLKEENIDILRKRLNESCVLSEEDFVKTIWIDVPMPIDYISTKLISDLKRLEPWGNGNEKPVFADKNLLVSDIKIIGKNNNAVKLKLVNERNNSIDGIYFGDVQDFVRDVNKGERYSFLYYPSINEYMGMSYVQIIILGVKV